MKDLKKSMLDLAQEQFEASKDPIKFSVLWENIVNALEMSEEEASVKLPLFYTSLSMDGRFVVLTEDLWDLKSKHTYNEVHPDINDIYEEDEEDDDLEEDDDEDQPKVKKSSSDDDDDEDSDNDDDEDSEREDKE